MGKTYWTGWTQVQTAWELLGIVFFWSFTSSNSSLLGVKWLFNSTSHAACQLQVNASTITVQKEDTNFVQNPKGIIHTLNAKTQFATTQTVDPGQLWLAREMLLCGWRQLDHKLLCTWNVRWLMPCPGNIVLTVCGHCHGLFVSQNRCIRSLFLLVEFNGRSCAIGGKSLVSCLHGASDNPLHCTFTLDMQRLPWNAAAGDVNKCKSNVCTMYGSGFARQDATVRVLWLHALKGTPRAGPFQWLMCGM